MEFNDHYSLFLSLYGQYYMYIYAYSRKTKMVVIYIALPPSFNNWTKFIEKYNDIYDTLSNKL